MCHPSDVDDLAQAAAPITVLAPFNLTGPQAVLGAPCYRGAELAVEKLNAAGGVLGRRIELTKPYR